MECRTGNRTGNRSDRKKEETKKRIIYIAMDLFMKQGFDKTTVDKIAEEADIAKGTIYNHFPVKEAIICEYVQRIIGDQGPEVLNLLHQLPDTRSRLSNVFYKTLNWMNINLNTDIYEKYFAYRMQVQTIRDKSLRSGLNNVLEYVLELGKETGEIRKDVPSKILAHNLEIINSVTAIAWVSSPESFSIYEAIDLNIDLFVNGVKA